MALQARTTTSNKPTQANNPFAAYAKKAKEEPLGSYPQPPVGIFDALLVSGSVKVLEDKNKTIVSLDYKINDPKARDKNGQKFSQAFFVIQNGEHNVTAFEMLFKTMFATGIADENETFRDGINTIEPLLDAIEETPVIVRGKISTKDKKCYIGFYGLPTSPVDSDDDDDEIDI